MREQHTYGKKHCPICAGLCLVSEDTAAERERCAGIAESHPGACQTGCETGEEIAKRIREGQ